MRYLRCKTQELQFCIELADHTTAVYGDGNTGKTCIFNKLIAAVNTKQCADKFLFINMNMLYNVKLLQQRCNALFIIDDFDAVRQVRPEIVELLNYSINQVLLFGRDLEGVRVDKHYLYRTNRTGNMLSFIPMFAEKL